MRRTLSSITLGVGLTAALAITSTGCGDLTRPNYNQLQIAKDPDVKPAATGAAAMGGANQPADARAKDAAAAPKAPGAAGATQPAVAPAKDMRMVPMKPAPGAQAGGSCGG